MFIQKILSANIAAIVIIIVIDVESHLEPANANIVAVTRQMPIRTTNFIEYNKEGNMLFLRTYLKIIETVNV